tara:strand:+ start:304 stop:516 length:213 start_codon:yes stop_codon:yes gene_type:complete
MEISNYDPGGTVDLPNLGKLTTVGCYRLEERYECIAPSVDRPQGAIMMRPSRAAPVAELVDAIDSKSIVH